MKHRSRKIEDDTDIALTARADVRLSGNWKQAKDFVDWARDEMGLFLGGAIHYEVSETGDHGSAGNPQHLTHAAFRHA